MAEWPYNSVAWRQVRKKVLKRDGYECQLRYPCCTGQATSADHRVPVSHLQRGDPAALDERNLQAACRECNSAKRDRLTGPGPGQQHGTTRHRSRRPRRIPAATTARGNARPQSGPRPPTLRPTTRDW